MTIDQKIKESYQKVFHKFNRMLQNSFSKILAKDDETELDKKSKYFVKANLPPVHPEWCGKGPVYTTPEITYYRLLELAEDPHLTYFQEAIYAHPL